MLHFVVFIRFFYAHVDFLAWSFVIKGRRGCFLMLEKIIRTYYDAIFRYCYHHVNSRAVAEDLCQETFASFIEHYAEIRSMGKAKSCLYTIAKNKCRDYYRKKAPLLVEEVPEQEKEECMEELVIVRQMIMSLPEAFREAVVLRYFQNLKYPEIAAVLGISLSLAKYRVKKGLELLSEMETEGLHERTGD